MEEKIDTSVNRVEEVRDVKEPVKKPFLIRFWWIALICSAIAFL